MTSTDRAPAPRAASSATGRALLAFLTFLGVAAAFGACTRDASEERGDVFVIVIDTLRRDSLRTFEPTMPLGEHFDALARDAIVFDDLRSGTSWTRPAVASLLTGQHSKRHGIHGRRDVLPGDGPHVVEAMRSAGYATHAWSANPNILPLWGFERGFDTFVDLGDGLPKEPGRNRRPKVDGAMAFERVLDAVEAADGPGFYYVHVVDPHRPYRPSDEILAELDAMGDVVNETFPVDVGSPFTRVVRDEYYRRYMGEVLDVDRALGAFVDRLRALGRYDAATILVVADHGEEFLEHGGEVHGFTLFEEVLRVPGLLKRAHGVGAGTRLGRAAELADLMPTLLASVGLAIPDDVDGRNLLEPKTAGTDEAGPRYADLFLDRSRLAAVYDGRHKLIVDYLSGRASLFDLEADPHERRNLVRKQPERAEQMRALIDQARARHAVGWHLRGCGCRDRTDRLGFDLAWDAEVDAASLDLESADVVELEPGAARVRWVLEPDPDRAVSDDARRADRDELVLSPSGPAADSDRAAGDGAAADRGDGDDAPASAPRVRVLPTGDGPLAVAFGRGRIDARDATFELEAERPDATIEASAPVDCLALVRAYAARDPGTGDYCRPHLRVWYVDAPEVRAGELDPDVRDRLRALGYAE